MKFEELSLKPEILKALVELGYSEATEIQSKCIPIVLSGKDIVGQSQTGSGKTAAFGVPMLNVLTPGKGIQAIVLTPTRELAVQVFDNIRSMGKYTGLKMACVYGGVSLEPQTDALRRADIVIGTPGRVIDHLDRRSMNLTNVKYFVLDEADRMLEMGFVDDVVTILKHTPKDRQSLMFSATMPSQIRAIIQRYFNNPVPIKGQAQVDTKLLKQVYYNVKPEEKFSLLLYFLKKHQGISVVFCATREESDAVAANLEREGVNVMAIHGGLTQNKRLQVVEMLKSKKITTIVATDVAARGLDIKDVSHVYNYDVPKSAEDYTHRIGRTARAGESGDAITLLTHKDFDNFDRVLRDRSLKITKEQIPADMPMVRFDRGMARRSFGGHQGRNFTNRGGRPQGGRGRFGGGRGGGSSRSGGGGYNGHRDSEGGSSERRSEGRSEGGEGRSHGGGHPPRRGFSGHNRR
ncbi:MAG TPA: DEAD/DEAH box helicase [Alphaproteobacteria bacterium]|nr:DEAD/DEAH box helicase [Alphaproteobacteria bacterium]